MQLNIGWIFNILELNDDVTIVPEKVNPKKAVRLEQKLLKNARKNADITDLGEHKITDGISLSLRLHFRSK